MRFAGLMSRFRGPPQRVLVHYALYCWPVPPVDTSVQPPRLLLQRLAGIARTFAIYVTARQADNQNHRVTTAYRWVITSAKEIVSYRAFVCLFVRSSICQQVRIKATDRIFMKILPNNRKSHMAFRFVPKSVTLNHLQRRNGHFLRYFAEFGSFRGQLRKRGWLAINRYSPEKCHKVGYTN